MKLFEPRCIAATGDTVGEGAVWSAPEQSLYWTDINRFLIHRYDEARCTTQTWFFSEPVVALALTNEPGRWLVALASKLIWWWPDEDTRRDHGFKLQDFPSVRLNDGRADPLGNFWIGSMRNNVLPNGEAGTAGGTDGKMFCIAPNGDVTEHIWNLGISNTLCWSPDQKTFYTADTLANVIWAFPFNTPQGLLGERKEFFAGYERGLPDGSAMDSEGFLWNCRFFGRCIVRVAPSGDIDRVIDMPVKNITTATFGGKDLRTLYVTSATADKDLGDRLAGSLWAIACAVEGLAENCVKVL